MLFYTMYINRGPLKETSFNSADVEHEMDSHHRLLSHKCFFCMLYTILKAHLADVEIELQITETQVFSEQVLHATILMQIFNHFALSCVFHIIFNVELTHSPLHSYTNHVSTWQTSS